MHRDRLDQPITSQSARAVELYDDAVDRMFALQPGSGTLIDEALDLDPSFALGHCAKARALAGVGDSAGARDYAVRGRDLAVHLPERERRHAQIVSLVFHGESMAALDAVRDHASAYPRDAVPLSFALGVYGLFGFGGFKDFRERQVELLETVADSHGQDDWWFLASYGWALVEAGRREQGIPMLDRALTLRPDNANAAHGRVHGYYEQGAAEEGEAFIEAWLPAYDRSAILHAHLAWHLGAVRVAARRHGPRSGDLPGQHPARRVADLAHVHDDRLCIVPATSVDCRLRRRRRIVGRGSSAGRRAVLEARHSLRQHAPRHGLCGRRRSRGDPAPRTGRRDAPRRRQAAVGAGGCGSLFGDRGVWQRTVPGCRGGPFAGRSRN